VTLDGEVEIDEVYVVAGHKGNSAVVAQKAGRRRRLKGVPGRGTLEKEKVLPQSRCKWPFWRARAFGCRVEGFDVAANFVEASG
jgi:hypothetical protein